MIRPARSPRTGLIGSLVTMARVFASPRAQATSVRSTPRPPSSPAPLSRPSAHGSPTTLPEAEHGVAIANAPATSGRPPLDGPPRDNRPLVLVVDDEESYRQALASGLTREGFAVEIAGDGHEALRLFHRVHPDLVLLDVMLPDQSGIEICQQMRSLKPVPIIMVTARDSEVDIVLGLELGASDYVAKPFRLRELVARMRAVLRRGVAVAEHHEEILARRSRPPRCRPARGHGQRGARSTSPARSSTSSPS